MSELPSWPQVANNGPIFYEKMQKYYNRMIMFIDYVPLLGPIYNVGHALNLLLVIWCNRVGIDDEDQQQDIRISKEKSRRIREKGLTAIVTALIDIFTICLAVGVIAFICDCLVRIQTFAFIRQICILFIMLNVAALTVGAKIITGQLVINVTRQLEDVNYVGTSMVKSVQITATAIERIVETTESTTNIFIRRCQYCWQTFFYYIIMVVTFPRRLLKCIHNQSRLAFRRFIFKTKMAIIRRMTWSSMMNFLTLGLSGSLLRIVRQKEI